MIPACPPTARSGSPVFRSLVHEPVHSDSLNLRSSRKYCITSRPFVGCGLAMIVSGPPTTAKTGSSVGLVYG